MVQTVPDQKAGTNQLNESVRFALFDTQVNVPQNEHYKRVVKDLLNESGVQEGARLSMDFDPSYQELIIHSVAIQRGTNLLNRLQPEQIKVIQQERDLERHVYNGALSAVVFLEDVRVGDRIDFSYTVRGANPILEGRYVGSFLTQWDVPVQRIRFRLLWPANRSLGIRNHLTTVQPAVMTQVKDIKEYLWDLRNLPAVVEEDSLPAWYDPLPWVQLSEFASWAEVAEWATRLYPATNRLSPELMEKVEAWQHSTEQPEARLTAALQFLQDEVRYLGFEFGPHSYRPTDPSVVFARRFGDCKDKSYLLCTILRRMGIEASPALVHTDYRDTIAEWLPSPYAFNHVITKVQLDGRTWWIDPTRSHQRGPLAQRYLPNYQRSLVVEAGTAALTPIPCAQSALPRTTSYESFQIRGRKEPAQLTVRTLAEGFDADRLRASFAETSHEELEKRYLNYYARQYPRIKMTGPVEIHDYSETNLLETVEHYEIQEFWALSKDQRQYVGEFYPQVIDDLLHRPTTALRSMPLSIVHPRHEILRTEVHLPEPWPVDNETESVSNAAVQLTVRRTFRTNTLVMEYEYRSLTNCVAVTEVAAYLKDFDKMENSLGYSLTWANESAPAKARQPNWSILALAAAYSVLLAIGAAALYRFRRHSPPPALEPEPDVLGRRLSGLGGWLILVGLGLVLGPFRIALGLAQLLPVYSLDTWQLLTTPSSESYHALFAPLLIFELLANLTLLVFSGLLVILFFQRRRTFPWLFILFLLFTAGVYTVDELGSARIHVAVSEQPHKNEPQDLARSYVACAIWIPYMLRSKRVKATFVR
jgi:transglutaminase-like putative cysteine protease